MKNDEIRVFISYSREDYNTAKRLYDDLKAVGVSTWMDDENLLVGQNWKETVCQSIGVCDYFLAVISSKSLNKKGYYQIELDRALNEFKKYPPGEIYIIPVRIDDCIPKHEILRDLNWADLFPSYKNGLAKIFRVLQIDPDVVEQKYGFNDNIFLSKLRQIKLQIAGKWSWVQSF